MPYMVTTAILIIIIIITVGLADQQILDRSGGSGHFDGGHADRETSAGPRLLLLDAFEQPRNGARYDAVRLRVVRRSDHRVRFTCDQTT